MNNANIDIGHLQKGARVAYTLLPKDRPVTLNRLWYGRIIRVYGDYAYVESLEPGYTGLTEWIEFRQIVGVEHG